MTGSAPMPRKARESRSERPSGFSPGRQMGNISLKIPLAFFTIGRGPKGCYSAVARIKAFGYPLNSAALACGISSFKDCDYLQPFVLYPFLQFYKLDLQPPEFRFILFFTYFFAHISSIG